MYAIVDIAGKQFKVAKDQFVYAPSLAGNAGDAVEFSNVLLLDGDDGMEVGAPLLSGVTIAGTILEHGRGDKVIIFKKKRRKGYRKTQGHRQNYTKVLIEDILTGGKKPVAKKEEPAATTEEKPKQQKAKTPAAAETQDDLTRITGIGPVYAEALHEQGIHTFQQIAELSAEDMDRLGEAISGITHHLIEEEDWVGQAKELIKSGGEPQKEA